MDDQREKGSAEGATEIKGRGRKRGKGIVMLQFVLDRMKTYRRGIFTSAARLGN